ncbi:hypothetical protein ACU686_27250 [Yinghuangia aomiensis]
MLPLFLLAAARVRSRPAAPSPRSLPATVAGLVVLLVPASSAGATGSLGGTLAADHFPVRTDALDLFGRTQTDSWQLFSPWEVLVFLLPLTVVLGAAVLCFARGTRWAVGRSPSCRSPRRLAPAALAFARLGHGTLGIPARRELLRRHLVLARRTPEPRTAVPLCRGRIRAFAHVHVPLTYFDGYQPRELTGKAMSTFVDDVTSGRFTHTPTR